VFVFAAAPKLVGQHTAMAMFSQIGAGQWLRYLVGTAELAGAIGLLIPRLAGLAAAGLAATLASHWPMSTEVFAAPMNDIPKTVVSSTLEEAGWDRTQILHGDLAEVDAHAFFAA
jgi:uncharacterized membrane protein YphA (DoxX/SURF4 family)